MSPARTNWPTLALISLNQRPVVPVPVAGELPEIVPPEVDGAGAVVDDEPGPVVAVPPTPVDPPVPLPVPALIPGVGLVPRIPASAGIPTLCGPETPD